MSHLPDLKSVLECIAEHTRRKETVVFTNGCFDVLHVGHVRYLSQARGLGDRLVVGINTDQSIKRLKGPLRPINSENDRLEVLLGLKAVDYAILFDEDTPENLIKQIRPQFLVKGGDWPVEKIVGAEFVRSYGGTVLALPFYDGYSSTETISKMQR
ncbi:MAG: D-glycero-beta-D-manno-heptose 1-phosphate adenylyltransferase [Deltaproteobacteria bacterium]|nr:D-glycero-beta-D-manno-heptose 1-phosphate adenylyltransferase [Deltaproteobacteria bacterium]